MQLVFHESHIVVRQGWFPVTRPVVYSATGSGLRLKPAKFQAVARVRRLNSFKVPVETPCQITVPAKPAPKVPK